ncbi:MAG: type IV pilus secretin PilQ [Nitrospiraceae bacterium]|nr:type IV pilus secretin PilQ [Nitrospiraceae bacterium]
MKPARNISLLLLLVFFLAAGLAAVKPAFAKNPTIKNLEVKDGLVQIEIDGAFTYTVYNPDPFNVTIDLPGVSAGAFAGRIGSPKAKGITSVNVIDGHEGAKVKVLLDSPASVKPSVKAGIFRLAIESAAPEAQPAQASAPAPSAKSAPAPDATVSQPSGGPVPGLTNGPAAAVQPGGAGPVPHPRQRISLDFENAQIVPIFMLLGQVGGYNVVVHPSVRGTITLKLKDVPWEQALDILLNTFGLGKRISGNVMTIAPLSQFVKWDREKQQLQEATQTSQELSQAVIKLNYAAASDAAGYISSAKLLSPRGNITTDNRMNMLIIKDIPSQIAKIGKLISIIDVPKPQVMIEAQIVEVSSDYTQNLGIRWGGTASFADAGTANPQKFDFSVNSPVLNAGPTIPGGTNFGASSSTSSSTPAGVGLFTLGTANSISLNLSLEALEEIDKSKTIANPKVLTLDNESATIMSGQSIPVQTTTAAGTTTQFVNANLNLTVTPRITPDGYVLLKVNAANDTLGTLTPQGYAIDKKNVTTQALVKNGETLVLGGIFKSTKNTSESGIPILSKIPILGWLFKTRQISGPNRDELLILITPRIVKSS